MIEFLSWTFIRRVSSAAPSVKQSKTKYVDRIHLFRAQKGGGRSNW